MRRAARPQSVCEGFQAFRQQTWARGQQATLIRTDEPRPWLGPDCVMRRSQFDEMQNGLEELKV